MIADLPPVATERRGDALLNARSTMRSLYERVARGPDAAFFADLYRTWDVILDEEARIAMYVPLPYEAAVALADLQAAARESEDPGAIAEWIDTLGRTAVTLAAVQPYVRAEWELAEWAPLTGILTNGSDRENGQESEWGERGNGSAERAGNDSFGLAA